MYFVGRETNKFLDTIITSFSEQFGKTSSDPSSVQRRIGRCLNMKETKIRSIYDLAIIILTECSMALLGEDKLPHPLPDQKPPVLDIFQKSVANLASK